MQSKNVKRDLWEVGYNDGFCGKKLNPALVHNEEYKAGYRVGKKDMQIERCF